MKAIDADEGINGELTYDLPLGIAEDKFRVDSRTGRITTTAPLDRESKSIYTLTVIHVRKNFSFPLYVSKESRIASMFSRLFESKVVDEF